MRYSASDTTEIIRLVEQSPLPARRTLEKLRIPRSSFYRWYDRYQRGGPEALADRPHGRIGSGAASQRLSAARLSTWRWISWNSVRGNWRCASRTRQNIFVSEASVYRLLEAHDLITSPAHIVIKAAEEFKTRPRRATSSGRPTSPISRSRARAGTTAPRCWTTSRASLSPGSSVRP